MKPKLHYHISQEDKERMVAKLNRAIEDIMDLEDENPTFHIIRSILNVANKLGVYAERKKEDAWEHS